MLRPALLLLLLGACASKPPPAPPAPKPPVVEQRSDVLARLDQVAQLREAGDDAQARTTLDELLAQTSVPLAHLERAQLLLDEGSELTLALADARHAAQALFDNPRALRVLGQALEESGDLAGAVDAYAQSLERKDDPVLRRRQASLLARAGRTAAAVLAWERLRDEAPDDVGARLSLAELYEQVDRPASAEDEWTRVAALSSTNVHLLRRFAEFMKRQGKVEEAQAIEAQADELDPPEDRQLRPLLPSKR